MKTIKKVISSALISVGVSLAIFTLVGMIFDLRGGGTFTLEGYGFTKMVLACIVTGLGFGVPSVLYSSEKLSPVLATVLHLGIGMAVYFTAASLVGWIPFEAGMTATFRRKAAVGRARRAGCGS